MAGGMGEGREREVFALSQLNSSPIAILPTFQ